MPRDFRRLNVWEKAHALTLHIYSVTMAFPKDELYGLTSQMRRAASSIPANIAEGCGREGNAELIRFLRIAHGSASELHYFVILAHDLKLFDDTTYRQLDENVSEVKRMVTGYVQFLNAKS